ncbi:MAG: TolC family protein [Marinilabiliales bacterium]|nr:TolC family protein [Marinilabiliales bacterium]
MATDATVSLVNSFGWRSYYNERNEGNPVNPATITAFTNNLSLKFDQPIFTYNRTKLQLSQLEFNLENTKISHELSKLSLERSVTQSFYSVYQQQQSLEIAKKAYDNMLESYEVSKAKAEAGISADVELYQAELNLANSRSDYENRLVSSGECKRRL